MREDRGEKWVSVCYVAGPYRASSEYLVKQNIRKAEDVAIQLWAAGFVPVCPHMNTAFFGGAYGLPDEVWLKGDLEIIKRCDFVVVIPGWQTSQGTLHEIEVARQAGLHVYFWDKEEDQRFLKNYYAEWRD
jgi:nucleoside 2-deoxyribosyltransferase